MRTVRWMVDQSASAVNAAIILVRIRNQGLEEKVLRHTNRHLDSMAMVLRNVSISTIRTVAVCCQSLAVARTSTTEAPIHL